MDPLAPDKFIKLLSETTVKNKGKLSNDKIIKALKWLAQAQTDRALLGLYEKGLTSPCFDENGKFGWIANENNQWTPTELINES